MSEDVKNKNSITKMPSNATLKRYGLTFEDWIKMFNDQDGKCFICQQEKDILCVDHEHVKGWKRMEPKQKKKYVRGLLCRFCNLRMLPKGMNIAKARRIVEYLDAYGRK